QAEADEVEGHAQDFCDDGEHQDVEEDGEEIALIGALIRPVAEFARPARDQQDDEQGEANHRVGHTQPALNAIVAAYLRRIGRLRIYSCAHPHKDKGRTASPKLPSDSSIKQELA